MLLAVYVATIAGYASIPEPFRIPVLVGLTIITSIAILALDVGERLSQARTVLSVVSMFMVTAVYLSYLQREVVTISVVLTAFVTAVMYMRVIKEVRRRRRI
jgi:hypothetical protein